MKKVVFIIFFLLLFHSYLCAQPDEELKSNNLAGQVRSVRVVNGNATTITLYNRQGKRTEATLYKPDGSVQRTMSYIYNDEGLMTGWKDYENKTTLQAEAVKSHGVFTYRAGKLIEAVTYNGDSISYRATYIYDNLGNKVQEINSGLGAICANRDYKYDADGNLVEETCSRIDYSTKVERVFDAKHNPVKEKNFENGTIKSERNRTYENGRLIKEEEFNHRSGKVERTTLNSYNSAGKLIESTVSREMDIVKIITEYDEAEGWIKQKEILTTVNPRFSSNSDTAPVRIVSKYNETGSEIERSYYSKSGTLIRRQASIFDERWKESERIFYKANGEIDSKQIFKYDEQGSRIKTILVAVSPQGETQNWILEERFISYY